MQVALAICEVNLRFCQLLGYSYTQSRQLLLTDITSVSSSEMEQAGTIGYIGLEEQVFRTLDGMPLDVEVSKSVVQVGSKKKVIATVRDISSRKREEAERVQMERQLLQSQKMEALDQLTGGIAHDFNNILAVMLGYSNLMLTRYATDKESESARYLEEIVKAGERARDLVARMLTYSRSQTDPAAATMNPGPLVNEVVKMLAYTIPSSIQLKAQIAADIPAICISPGELHQIVMNLVINAKDAMAEHGRLDIGLNTFEQTSESCLFCKRAHSNVFAHFCIKLYKRRTLQIRY